MGRFVYRFRWWIIAGWAAAALLLAVLAPKADVTPGENSDLLPADTPVHLALDQLGKHFGDNSALSSIVVVFERREAPLTADDLAALETVAGDLKKTLPGEAISSELSAVSIRTPGSLGIPAKDNPLISSDGHAALIWESIPYNYITKSAARLVQHAQRVVGEARLPRGLTASVTGSAGFGYDYSIATQRSHDKTLIVTLVAVVLILLMVYRAPLAAAAPLVAISVAAAAVFKLLDIAAVYGFHNGTAEQIFTFVLLYGAGIDYSLLLISRYRELLDTGAAPTEAIVTALDASVGAITSSAAMTAAGLLMLLLGRFSVYRDSAPTVVLAVIGAAASAITLSPAIVGVLGPRMFWPNRSSRKHAPDAAPFIGKIWPKIARVVVHHPGWVMLLTLAALLPPAVRGLHIDWSYDALTSLKDFYPARQGAMAVQRHWPIGEIAPVDILAVSSKPQSPDAWIAAAGSMTQAARAMPMVADVRSAADPLGLLTPTTANQVALVIGRQRVLDEFVSPDAMAMRMTVVLRQPPFTQQSMDAIGPLRAALADAARQGHIDAKIYISGATAEMVDLRSITGADFARVAPLSLAVILLVVMLVLRDVLLSIFILAATTLSYATTLGLTDWFFHATGATGLEWKVQMLLFIVLVAVGQDYSIFFAMRLAQESRHHPLREASRRALVFTGPVISSCGLIMAATLGSVMAGDVQTLVQLGFAFMLGMLIDTFLVRPLLLPAFVLLTGRTLKRAAVHHENALELSAEELAAKAMSAVSAE